MLSRYRLVVLSRLLSAGAGQAILTIRLFTGTYSNDSNIIVYRETTYLRHLTRENYGVFYHDVVNYGRGKIWRN